MKKNSNEKISRRDFLKTLGFSVCLTSLLGGSAALAIKGKGNLSGQTCGNRFVCRACGQVNSCGLPQALSYKTVTGKAD